MFQPSQPSPVLPPVQGQKGYVPSPIDWRGKFCHKCCSGGFGNGDHFANSYLPREMLILFKKPNSFGELTWQLHCICHQCGRWVGYGAINREDDPLFPIGLRKKSKAWWWEFRAMLMKTQPQHIAEFIYDLNRKRLYEARTEFRWEHQFPPFVVGKLHDILREIEKDFDCVDNERVADKSKRRQRKRFWKQAAEGCCGSHYEEVELNGKTYMIGFNHGH